MSGKYGTMQSDVLCMKGNAIQSVDSLNFDELFNIFKVFQANYKFEKDHAKFIKLIDLLDLGDYKKSFLDAIDKKSSTSKFNEDSPSLKNIFDKLFQFIIDTNGDKVNQLKLIPKHIDDILTVYNFKSNTDKEKAQLLLILSGIFAKYSSSSFFGTEYDSPTAIRYYAYGLMEASFSLCSDIFPNNNDNSFETWKNKFLGINKAFTCADTLSDSIKNHCKKFNNYYSEVIPPAWL